MEWKGSVNKSTFVCWEDFVMERKIVLILRAAHSSVIWCNIFSHGKWEKKWTDLFLIEMISISSGRGSNAGFFLKLF